VQTGAARRRNRSRDRTRSVKPEWRGSGLLTRSQVARNHPGPPFRTSDPSGKGPGLLNRRESYVGSSPTWSSNQSARGEIGRRTILRGWRETMSVRLRPSAPLPHNRPAMQLVKRIRCLRISEGFDPLQVAILQRSVAQSGSASRSGREGRRFKSCRSDQARACSSIGRAIAS
jgi:hypothetical protein